MDFDSLEIHKWYYFGRFLWHQQGRYYAIRLNGISVLKRHRQRW